MREQYSALALQTTVKWVKKREEIKKNIDHIASLLRIIFQLIDEMDGPIRLVALPEGALGGFPGSLFDDHVKAALEVYNTTIPGEETDLLSDLCKQYGFYLIAQLHALDPDFLGRSDRYFNTAFIIDPQGKVIHKHRKTAVYAKENSLCPTDIWDLYIEKYGKDPKKLLEAVFPVARTEIGNIGTLICAEGGYPEPARALALNGAEIIYRANYMEPLVGNKVFEVQNRSHAVFNTCYVIVPNLGDHFMAKSGSMIIDYRGQITSVTTSGGDSYASAIIDIEGLRDYRVGCLKTNFLKDLRVEQYRVMYDFAETVLGGIYPSNLCITEPPMKHAEHVEIMRYVINKLVKHGVWTPPRDWKPFPVRKKILEKVKKA